MRDVAAKTILLCVAGSTPQIITEALYAMMQSPRGERVDEIRVITTLGGRDRLLKYLLDPACGQFFAFCRDYGLDPAAIKFDETTITLLRTPDGRTLADIRSVEENEWAADQICEIVRELAKDPNTRIHASVAGGRKTMSIYLTTAMQLFGRAQDRLSHVLVSEEFEGHPEFFYKPPQARDMEVRDRHGNVRRVSTDDAQIHLADIPFIRLRGLRSDWRREDGGSYGELVRAAQVDLDLSESLHELKLELKARRISAATCQAKLPPKEFFVYSLFAWLRKERRGQMGDGFLDLGELSREHLDAVFRQFGFMATDGRPRTIDETELVPGYEFLGTLLTQLEKDFPALQENLRQTRAKINRKLSVRGFPPRFHIESQGRYSETRYGLPVSPDHLRIF